MKALMFGAYYCGYCKVFWDRVMEPLVDEGYNIEYIDAMKQPHLADKYHVRNVPNIVILDGDEVQVILKGAPTQEQIRNLLCG